MFVQNFHAREWSQAGRSLYRQSHKIEAISKGGGEGGCHIREKKIEDMSEGEEKIYDKRK